MFDFLLHNPFYLYSALTLGVILLAIVIYFIFFGRASTKTSSGAQQVYVGNLSYRVKEYHLREFFSQFGEIKQLRIIKNHNTGRSKGFGFVTFSTSEAADKSLKSHGKDFEGRALVVRFAKPK